MDVYTNYGFLANSEMAYQYVHPAFVTSGHITVEGWCPLSRTGYVDRIAAGDQVTPIAHLSPNYTFGHALNTPGPSIPIDLVSNQGHGMISCNFMYRYTPVCTSNVFDQRHLVPNSHIPGHGNQAVGPTFISDSPLFTRREPLDVYPLSSNHVVNCESIPVDQQRSQDSFSK